MKRKNSVLEGILTDEQHIKLQLKFRKIRRCINSGMIPYQDAVTIMDLIVEDTVSLHLGVLKGTHKIKERRYVIDGDADPFIPEGYTLESHQTCGKLTVSKSFFKDKLPLFMTEKQKLGQILVDELLEALKETRVPNANVMYFLFENQNLIPKEWEKGFHPFYGTTYRDRNNCPCVRGLRMNSISHKYEIGITQFDYISNGSSTPILKLAA